MGSTGDDDFTKFYQHHYGQAWGFCQRSGLTLDEAEGVLTDAFTIIYRKWSEIDEPGRVSYFYRVLLNGTRTEYHRRGRRPRQTFLPADPYENVPDALIEHRDPFDHVVNLLSVKWALPKLPEREREAVLLIHYVELGYRTAAAVMGNIAVGTVKNYASLGCARLKRIIDADADDTRKDETR